MSPMGIVSDTEFESELNNSSTDRINKVEVVDMPSKGRGDNNVQVPDGLRKIIGEESEINGRDSAVQLAKQFGISPSSVSAYANGSTSTKSYDEPKEEIVNHINSAKERISKKARHKLFLALRHITEEKLSDAKPEVLAGIARNMSAVVKEMEPEVKSQSEKSGGPQFIFYAPQFVKEEKFEVIHAKE